MRRIDLTLPSGWNKLTEKQLFEVSKAFLVNKGENYLLTQCFMILIGLKMKKGIAAEDGEFVFTFYKKGVDPFQLNMQTLTPMVKKLEWLTKDLQPLGLLPRLLRFKGCNYKLYKVDLERYLRMDTNFRAFSFTGQKKYFHKFLSVVYNKPRFLFHLVPVYKKQAALFWFSGVKPMLKQKYPYIWPETSDGENSSDEEVVFSIMASLNSGDITRNKAVLKSHVHEAFYQLNLMVQQVKPQQHV